MKHYRVTLTINEVIDGAEDDISDVFISDVITDTPDEAADQACEMYLAKLRHSDGAENIVRIK